MIEDDVSLYDALKKKVNNINISQLTWRDPEASMVLSDNSEMINTLKRRQKRVFMVRNYCIFDIIMSSDGKKCLRIIFPGQSCLTDPQESI